MKQRRIRDSAKRSSTDAHKTRERGRGSVSEIGMLAQDSGVPTRDAFWVMPVKEGLDTVIQVRNRIKVLKEFDRGLTRIVNNDAGIESDVLEQAAAALETGEQRRSKLQAFIDARHAAIIGGTRRLSVDNWRGRDGECCIAVSLEINCYQIYTSTFMSFRGQRAVDGPIRSQCLESGSMEEEARS